ncbi:hypothetical protein E2C01_076506 [Portunus trituberculatus]|uniref:Uncharacterized protein n=1 Tax=Portunus trituberculatus TaxID=210409 RepID=A0A5B7IM79_PORTR|nr:hypothetical protein [Portunus trituberculatus]
MTQWTLALSTLWVTLRVALRTLYIIALVISWSFVATEAVARSLHYARVSQSCAYTYERHTASHDRVAMRLRLGYKYFWEVSASPSVCCVVCGAPRGNTLRHYIVECPLIAKFRPHGQHDLYSLIDHLLFSTTLRDILREYPQFVPRL